MSIKTQVRLQQVTGSVPSVSIGQGSQDPGAADVQDLMAAYAKAIANIHGDVNFLAQQPGEIDHSDNDLLLRTTRTSGIIKLDAQGSGADGDLKLEATQLLSGSAPDVKVASTSGHVKVDSESTFHIQSFNNTGGSASTVDGGAQLDLEADYSGGGMVRLVAKQSGAQVNASINGSTNMMLIESISQFSNVPVSVTDLEDAFEAGEGALRVSGGASVGSNLVVGADLIVTGARVELIDADASLQFAEDTHRILADSTLNSFQIESGAKLALTGAGGVEIHSDGSGAGVSLQADAAGIYLSGSQGIAFKTDGSHAGFGGAVDLAAYGEGPTWEAAFTGKSIFGAMLQLNTSITNTEPTRFENKLSGDVTAVAGAYPVQVAYVAGDNSAPSLAEWVALEKNQLEVFVNGQLLQSGSSEDYVLDATTTRTINFQFPILDDDLVVAIER